MDPSPNTRERPPITRTTLLISEILRTLFYTWIDGVILFIAAGRMDWTMAWLYLVAYAAYQFISQHITPLDWEQPQGRKAPWEGILNFMYRMTHPIVLALAGMEFRLVQEQYALGLVIQIVAFIFLLATFALMLWAEKVNPQYHARLSTEANQEQEIVSTGPYQFIRHPGYLGHFMLALARPLMLGSLLGLGPGILGAIIMLLRTALEDRTLQNTVDGYKSYAKTVRYRLFEGIW
jgi:protein-S-isoprenylcysteine O-methyltransferase Ste14